MRRRVQKVKNVYLLKKEQKKSKYYLQVIGNILCRLVTSASMVVALIAVAAEGPSVIARRLMMLACAAVLIFIARRIENRIYMELPLDKYFEEE